MEMTFYERIKQMTEKEMKMFIYWVYQNGWTDHGNACEDSPGDWSFFGGAICDQPAEYVEAKLDDYYDKEWRDEPLGVWLIVAEDPMGNVFKFERKLRSNCISSELEAFKKDVLKLLCFGSDILCVYKKNNVGYFEHFDAYLKNQNGGKDADVE